MAKNNSTFGKFLALTTAVAAIGGACYIFRDQIKESEVYKKSKDKLSSLRDKMTDKLSNEEDDFFFDDEFEDDFEEDVFTEDAKNNREYTSITINSKDTTDKEASLSDNDTNVEDEETMIVTASIEEDLAMKAEEDIADTIVQETEDVKEIFSDVTIPTITFGTSTADKNEEAPTAEEASAYENEGLSDVEDDPDTLAEQDRLDF